MNSENKLRKQTKETSKENLSKDKQVWMNGPQLFSKLIKASELSGSKKQATSQIFLRPLPFKKKPLKDNSRWENWNSKTKHKLLQNLNTKEISKQTNWEEREKKSCTKKDQCPDSILNATIETLLCSKKDIRLLRFNWLKLRLSNKNDKKMFRPEDRFLKISWEKNNYKLSEKVLTLKTGREDKLIKNSLQPSNNNTIKNLLKAKLKDRDRSKRRDEIMIEWDNSLKKKNKEIWSENESLDRTTNNKLIRLIIKDEHSSNRRRQTTQTNLNHSVFKKSSLRSIKKELNTTLSTSKSSRKLLIINMKSSKIIFKTKDNKNSIKKEHQLDSSLNVTKETQSWDKLIDRLATIKKIKLMKLNTESKLKNRSTRALERTIWPMTTFLRSESRLHSRISKEGKCLERSWNLNMSQASLINSKEKLNQGPLLKQRQEQLLRETDSCQLLRSKEHKKSKENTTPLLLSK